MLTGMKQEKGAFDIQKERKDHLLEVEEINRKGISTDVFIYNNNYVTKIRKIRAFLISVGIFNMFSKQVQQGYQSLK